LSSNFLSEKKVSAEIPSIFTPLGKKYAYKKKRAITMIKL